MRGWGTFFIDGRFWVLGTFGFHCFLIVFVLVITYGCSVFDSYGFWNFCLAWDLFVNIFLNVHAKIFNHHRSLGSGCWFLTHCRLPVGFHVNVSLMSCWGRVMVLVWLGVDGHCWWFLIVSAFRVFELVGVCCFYSLLVDLLVFIFGWGIVMIGMLGELGWFFKSFIEVYSNL